MRIDNVAAPLRWLSSVKPDSHVLFVSREPMAGHLFQPARTVDLERRIAIQRGRRQDQVRISGRVVGMQVRDESRLEILRFQCCHAATRRAVHHDGGAWTSAVGIGVRRAGAKQHDLRLRVKVRGQFKQADAKHISSVVRKQRSALRRRCTVGSKHTWHARFTTPAP